MNPELFSIGGLSIRWYSVLILCGVIIGFLLAEHEGKKQGYEKDLVFDLGFWCVLFGIVGARLYYVIFNFSLYRNDFWEIFRVWNGGLAIHGGILGGFLTAVIYCKKKDVSLFAMTDIIVPSLIIAQAIGRWGNFFNSEAHGPETTLAFLRSLKFIPSFVIDGMYINGVYYHPTFYYEFLWCLMGFVVLLIVRKCLKNRLEGRITGFYLFWYGLGRFFIEGLRTDSLMFGMLKMAQIVSLLFIFVGIYLFVFRKEKRDDKCMI